MLLIKNALLPDFDTLTTAPADLLIENGRFAAIAPQLSAQCETLDAHGMLALPGMAPVYGTSRLTFGFWQLSEGVELTSLLLGMFGIGDLLAALLPEPVAGGRYDGLIGI